MLESSSEGNDTLLDNLDFDIEGLIDNDLLIPIEDDILQNQTSTPSVQSATEENTLEVHLLDDIEFIETSTDSNSLDDEEILQALEEDSKELQQIKEVLCNKGYVLSDDIDYKTLEKLVLREDLNTQDKIQKELNTLLDSDLMQQFPNLEPTPENLLRVKYYKTILELATDFSSSEATFTRDLGSTDMSTAFLSSLKLPVFIENISAETLIKYVLKYIYDESITADYILTKLIEENVISEEDAVVYGDILYQFIDTCLTKYKENVKSQQSKMQHSQYLRIVNAKKLLSEELKFRQALLNTDFALIRQIIKINDEYAYTCTKCGSREKIKERIVNFIIYPSENKNPDTLGNYNYQLIPNFLECSCGQKHLLYPGDYSDLKNHLKVLYRDKITSFVDLERRFSNGSSFARIKPTNKIIDYAISCITYSVDDNDDISKVNANNNTKQSIIQVISPLEVKQATEEFYTKIKQYTTAECMIGASDIYKRAIIQNQELFVIRNADLPEKDKVLHLKQHETVSYKDLAKVSASMLNKKYSVLKNQAIVTLLTFFKETPIFNYRLNYDYFTEIQSNVELVQNNISKSWDSLDALVLYDLYCIYTKYVGVHRQERTSDSLDLYDGSLQESMHIKLQEYVNENKEYLQSFYKKREKLLQQIKVNVENLSYLKIINFNQYILNDLRSFLIDKDLFKLVDEISDRMIITNLANDLYKPVKLATNFAFYNTISAKVSLDKIAESITKKLHSVVNTDKVIPMKYFKNLTNLSSDNSLQALQKAFVELDYYAFMREVSKISEVHSLLSADLDKRLNDAIILADSYCDVTDFDNVSYYEYYLSEFTKEEIKECEEQLRSFRVHRYRLNRLSGESLSDYLVRYNKLSYSNLLSSDNSKDYLELFKPFEDYACELSTAAVISGQNYNSYTEAMYINSLLKLCTDLFDYTDSAKCIGLPASIFNKIKNGEDVDILKDEMLEIFKATFDILNSYYYTSLRDYFAEIKEKGESLVISTSQPLNTLCKEENIISDIKAYLSKPESDYKDTSDNTFTVEDIQRELIDNCGNISLLDFLR